MTVRAFNLSNAQPLDANKRRIMPSIDRARGHEMAAETLTIELSPETYARLRARAREQGKTPEALLHEMNEDALPRDNDPTGVNTGRAPRQTVREILAASGRLRELG